MNAEIIIIASWAAFLVVWGISALFAKKDVKQKSIFWSQRGYAVRLIVIVLLVAFAIWRAHGGETSNIVIQDAHAAAHPIMAGIGALCAVLGIGFAIWARVHLGRNWSSHPTQKEHHELVTSGPYRVVRHPIYTGMLLAIIGSGLASGWWWSIPFIFATVVFVRRVYKEEQIMTNLFPDTYPAYKKRTWALIPYVW